MLELGLDPKACCVSMTQVLPINVEEKDSKNAIDEKGQRPIRRCCEINGNPR